MLEMGTEKPIVLHVKYLILTTNKLVQQFSNKFSDLKIIKSIQWFSVCYMHVKTNG